jgi:hypothetical protein
MVLQFEFSNRTRSLSRASLSRRDGTVCDGSEDVRVQVVPSECGQNAEMGDAIIFGNIYGLDNIFQMTHRASTSKVASHSFSLHYPVLALPDCSTFCLIFSSQII